MYFILIPMFRVATPSEALYAWFFGANQFVSLICGNLRKSAKISVQNKGG